MKVLLIALLFTFLHACTSKQEQASAAKTIDKEIVEKNKELIRRVYADMVNKRNFALIDSFFSPDIYDHGAFEGQEQGREGFRKAVTGLFGLFSEVQVTVQEVIAEGDMIATREIWNATMAANKKQVAGETLHMFRIKDGKITDEWSKGWEWLGM